MSHPPPQPPTTPAADPPDVIELAANLRLAVMRLARRLRQRADAGATPSMLSALSSVERMGPMTLGELAAVERVTPPTMSAIVGRMEDAGLVGREVDALDRRVARVSLTRDGKRLLERIRSRKTAYLARRLRKLGPEDRAAIRDALAILERLAGDER